ncbi:MAG: efflux RND transporter periplasmic adaptor subunit [bacterium]|nr:efflux RND transporter periplasmic adaptor subunit [bacterium]
MIDQKRIQSLFKRFALRGAGGLVGLVAVAILAFSFGAIFFGGDEQRTESPEHSVSEQSKESTVWTCSMHPQIKLPKAGKCPICFMDLIPLETGSGSDVGPRQLRMSETAKSLARIQTTPATYAFAEAEIRMVGKVTYDETKLSYITAWVPGRLDRLYADYTGMTVKKGDHMVYMYSPELLSTQEELLQSLSLVEALDNSSSRVLKSTAEATLSATRDKLRLFGLSADQIEKMETDETVSDHLTINAPIGGVVIHKNAQEGMYVQTGTRIYTIADLTKLWVMFEAYESDLQWLRYGQQVSFTSPSFSGESFEAIISFIDPVVNPKTRTIQVRAIVENKELKLKPDMFVRGVVKSRIDGAGRVIDDYLSGKWISPMHPEVVKSGPGVCDVCGMDLVRAESLGYASKVKSATDKPLLIPASAPMITGKRAVVYVEIPNDEGPLYEGREVELGPRAGDFYVVKSGIKEGEQVVTNGAFKIDSELQIQAKPSMMSPEGGATSTGHQHGEKSPGGSKHSDMGASTSTSSSLESKEALAALTPVYNAYFDLQMALAGDDLAAATQAAGQVKITAGQVDMSLFSRTGHGLWMKLSNDIVGSALSASSAEDIKDARASFFHLSSSMIELHDAFGHADSKDYYLTYCPMAMDNAGAYWIQTQDTVWNSFYGDMMLRCGEIKKPLSARSPEGSN